MISMSRPKIALLNAEVIRPLPPKKAQPRTAMVTHPTRSNQRSSINDSKYDATVLNVSHSTAQVMTHPSEITSVTP